MFKGAPRACLTAFGALVKSSQHTCCPRESSKKICTHNTALQVQDKRQELQQGEMHSYYSSETKILNMDARSAALKEWKNMAQEDRAVYQARAAGKLTILQM